MPRLLAASLAALVVLGACRNAPTDRASAPPAAARGAAGAPAEGLCEHGVLAAICPKCHPKLAAVFQAKGDWCAEHGLPESVCPACHPERGGRPAADVSSKDGAPGTPSGPPPDGTKVRFKTKDTARLAGIETMKAEERPNAGGIVVTARLAYDATRLAQLNPRSPGVLRSLKVDVGARVKKGAPLAVIESAEVGADRSKLEGARARVELARKSYERQAALEREGVGSKKDTLAAEQDLAAANAEAAALASALSTVGGGGAGGAYTLTAPIDGVVTKRSATVGKLVGSQDLLFEIVDVSALWVDLDVPESELQAVTVGGRALVEVDGLEGRQFEGRVSYVSPEIDPHTRTATARVPLENPEGLLRANMYGRARVLVGGTRSSVMVPAAAVQRVKSVELVFVRRAVDEYEARHVTVGQRRGTEVELVKGVRPGEDVVTQGSFLLKTETLKESIGAGCCDAD